MVGPCSSCGPFNQYCGHHSAAYWPMQQQQQQQYPQYNNNYTSFDDDETDYMYSSSSSSSSYSSVDCTLSLGTPSTRMTSENAKPTPHRNSVSSFCWDLLHPKQSSSSTPKPSRTNNHAAAAATGGADPLFVRRCANCDTTSTPLWRNGPRGPKSLCNACGIRFKKEERRAAAATTTAAANSGATAGMMDPHHGYYNGSWTQQYGQATPQKMQCYGAPNEFRFIEDDRGSDASIQFLSWLTHDRPSGLVHDFTR